MKENSNSKPEASGPPNLRMQPLHESFIAHELNNMSPLGDELLVIVCQRLKIRQLKVVMQGPRWL